MTTGAADLSLDVANLQEVTSVTLISTTDRVALESIANSNETRKATLDNIFTDFASTGIGALADAAGTSSTRPRLWALRLWHQMTI